MRKFKRWPCLLLFLGIFLLVSGMSGFGKAPDKIPTPASDFTVVLIDQADVRAEVSMFSINGFTYFPGYKGKGAFSIPFENLESVEFRLINENLEAVVNLKQGQAITLQADRSLDCYGRTNFGTFQIKLGDIKQLFIKGLSPSAD
ncbi:MAG: hypothetical protein JRI95_12425 [Deltaproteobacteria bacterium]|nr:hypothetical protein [Deltaproteobacteria bacterium]MBW2086416.1 hypothetical protein [Deltaproteobacteria bacterium]